jgi:N-methylhydantoinase B
MAIAMDRTKLAPWGLNGGRDGLPNYGEVISKGGRKIVNKATSMPLTRGDIMITNSGGGGGYGSPMEREIDMVVSDVTSGYVSLESAKRDYGVVINPHTGKVDLEATRKLRSHD